MKTLYNLDRQLGVKSYSFRHIKDNADVAAAVLQCGATVIDLSGCHVDYDDPEQQDRAIETYRHAGISISGIADQSTHFQSRHWLLPRSPPAVPQTSQRSSANAAVERNSI